MAEMEEKQKTSLARVLWFTGLSGSGKSTIALALKSRLEGEGRHVRVIDGDDVRSKEHKHLGFSREDIEENNRLIAQMCKRLQPEFDYILVPIISPLRESRENARRELGGAFVEVYVNASLETCMRRDAKGLYKKALSGRIKNFIGVDPHTPYEPPENPDVVINTEKDSVGESVEKIMKRLGIGDEMG